MNNKNNIDISIIVPCFNELKYIDGLVSSVLNQTFDIKRLELIIVDGGSSDGTHTKLRSLKSRFPFMRIFFNPLRTVPNALNIGIKQARGRFIARMDVHAKYPKNYLERLHKASLASKAANVGCCIKTLPGNRSSKALAIAYALSNPFGVGNSYFRIGINKPRKVDTVPFGFFRRELFAKIGGFDTEIPCGEDHELNARIKKAGMDVYLIPGDEIHYYSRDNFTKLATMMFQYGLSRPIVNKKIGSPATVRQFAPLILVLTLLISMLLAPFSTFFLHLFIGVGVLYLSANAVAAALSARHARRRHIKIWWQTALAFGICHFSYGIGYIAGLLSLVLQKPSHASLAKVTR